MLDNLFASVFLQIVACDLDKTEPPVRDNFGDGPALV